MTDPHSRRRLPVPLARYGHQIRAHAEQLEREPDQAAKPPDHRGRRIVSLGLGAVAAAVGALVVLLDTGRPAHAESIVNKAPAAAAASESVRFTSSIKITLDSRQLEDYTQTGTIDFSRHSFSTVLSFGRQGGAIIERRVGGHLYVSQIRQGHSRPTRWLAVRLAQEPPNRFAAGAESEEFTAPPTLLDGLASTRSPVAAVAHEAISGVPTTVYELHTTLGAFLRAATGRQQPAAYQQVHATIKVALDGQGRPRRVAESFSGTRAQITTSVTFTSYGTPVQISAPSRSAVVARAPLAAPEPLAVSPSRVFERLLFLSGRLGRLARH